MLNKVLTLLKADRHSINIVNNNMSTSMTKKISSTGLVVIVIALMCFTMGMYANMIAEELYKNGYTYVMLAIMIFMSLVITITNTIYKSQGMLFLSKDNDLLLSLPIEKKTILTVRIIKLMLSQYIWTMIILIPSIAVYAYYEGLTLNLIISSIVMLIAIPVIPVIIGTIFGYIATAISSRFKKKNTMQIIISIITFLVVFYISFNLTSLLEDLLNKAQDIYITLKQIYYPLGLYIECLSEIKITGLLQIIAINLVPLIVFILVFSFGYFKLISKLSENHSKSKFVFNKIKSKSVFESLLAKEAKKYFRSSVYLLNTIIGPLLLIMGTVYLAIERPDIYAMAQGEEQAQLISLLNLYLPILLYIIVMFAAGMTNISASSISIEGKNIQILKSLPLNISDVFLAKIMLHFLVVMVPCIISITVLGVILKLAILDIIIVLVSVGLATFMLSVIGVVINLLLPKLDANDIAIVKQSASSVCSMIIGILFAVLVIYLLYKFQPENPVILLGFVSFGCVIITNILWLYLEKFGVKKFQEL